jgi:hypothetical protein
LELLHDDAHQQQAFSLSRILATHPYEVETIIDIDLAKFFGAPG